MKLLTRDSDYALRAVCFIAKQNMKVVPVPLMVQALRIPRPFLRKILQILNRKKILKSYKGSGGGFSLETKPDQVLVTEIIEIFQGPVKLNECLLSKSLCPDVTRCVLRKRIAMIEALVVKELKKITVASLLS
jgi:Rrf2 family protein